MKKLILARRALCLIAAALIGGCGTFFPAKPAERAADRIIDEVYQDKQAPAAAYGESDTKKP